MNQIKLLTLATLAATSSLVFTSCESEEASAELETSENVLQELNSKKKNKNKKKKEDEAETETETEVGFTVERVLSTADKELSVDGLDIRGDITLGYRIEGDELFFIAKLPKPISIHNLVQLYTVHGVSSEIMINGESLLSSAYYASDYKKERQVVENSDGTVSLVTRISDLIGNDNELVSHINNFAATYDVYIAQSLLNGEVVSVSNAGPGLSIGTKFEYVVENPIQKEKEERVVSDTKVGNELIVGQILSLEGAGFHYNNKLVGGVTVGMQALGDELFLIANLPAEIPSEAFLFLEDRTSSNNRMSGTIKLLHEDEDRSRRFLEINGEKLSSRNYKQEKSKRRVNEDDTVTIFTRIYDIKDNNGDPVSQINNFGARVRFNLSQTSIGRGRFSRPGSTDHEGITVYEDGKVVK